VPPTLEHDEDHGVIPSPMSFCLWTGSHTLARFGGVHQKSSGALRSSWASWKTHSWLS